MDNESDDLMSTYLQLLASQAEQLKAREQKIEELADKLGKFVLRAKDNPDEIQYNKNKGKEAMTYHLPKGCSLRQKKDGRWEGRLMKYGQRVTIACRLDKKYVYTQLMKAYRELHPKKPAAPKTKKALTLFSWLDQWHEVYRMPKQGNGLSKNTIIMDLSMIRKIKRVLKDVKLKDLKASYIQERLNSMTETRTTKAVYSILKLAAEQRTDAGKRLRAR